MKSARRTLVSVLVLACITCWQQAQAGFDKWVISEIFSSADGSVQFIELATTASSQQNLSGQTLVSANSAATQQKQFTFPGDLANESTAGHNVLIATAKFEQLTGLEADFTIASDFISTEGGSLSFAGGISNLSYSKQQLPKNGVQSLGSDGEAIFASPRNYLGLSASVNAELYATFDVDSSVLSVPVLYAPGVGVGNVQFQVNLSSFEFTLLNDFYLYQAGITAGDEAAQLLNGNTLYLPGLVFGEEIYEARLNLLDGVAMVFGNPEVISVRSVEPEPDLQLEQSIANGQLLFNQMCASCHGPDGSGIGNFPSLLTNALPSFDLLRSSIDTTMPLGNANSCTDDADSACATDISNYIINVLR